MAVDTEKYSEELRKLCEDYFFHDISHAEYELRRNDIFNRIEHEIATGVSLESHDADELYDASELAENLQFDPD